MLHISAGDGGRHVTVQAKRVASKGPLTQGFWKLSVEGIEICKVANNWMCCIDCVLLIRREFDMANFFLVKE